MVADCFQQTLIVADFFFLSAFLRVPEGIRCIRVLILNGTLMVADCLRQNADCRGFFLSAFICAAEHPFHPRSNLRWNADYRRLPLAKR